ncbi:MAG: 30S ribosomal protein S4 [Bacteroidetes bacterium HGW-Bacteroidetes-14]|nr:MAG: 30S ribosomal protein S4 [candidate division BRC1 bacterium HGW-BRC1-1]PKP38361.1 MAG: 30S ribosomal protein S4 [Bacteroidetes bacterium HGW-Bacteroidetes-14]
MARYVDAKCRLCRREGMKLFLKGTRCFSSKCAIERQNYPPGQHGQARTKITTYGQQLREKQKAKRTYGILERQFRRYFAMADSYRGVTGTVLLQMLERRLDNIVYRLGIGASRAQARQFVNHGHVFVNGRRVNIPSFLAKPGDEIVLAEGSRVNQMIIANLEDAKSRGRLAWLDWNPETFSGKMLSIPSREDIPTEVNEQLIVELYSK